ncbi:2-keto-4-pentenoate hydratase [Actinomadura sp. CNU-125]|uniref:2-keto-4-pentenoate hydratase n=1 Tax=Actinomadura sp. CNU-125 TaxID=1904961 RepID=UPI000A87F853
MDRRPGRRRAAPRRGPARRPGPDHRRVARTRPRHRLPRPGRGAAPQGRRGAPRRRRQARPHLRAQAGAHGHRFAAHRLAHRRHAAPARRPAPHGRPDPPPRRTRDRLHHGRTPRRPGRHRRVRARRRRPGRAGLEVIDSRYTDFKFALPDVVADNASSARYVVGDRWRDPADLDLAAEPCRLEIDGEEVDSATGAAVQGHPAEALALAANTLARRGIALEPGWIVLTGGLTDAVFAAPGRTITAAFAGLGAVTLHCR